MKAYELRWVVACAAVAVLGQAALGGERVRAFPGAEGFGAYAQGGRGGKVLFVTNLEDYDPRTEKPIPGSFRAACCEKGPRTIVFRISGTIPLKVELTITEPYLTIAGQTAPGDGICVRNHHSQVFNTHDIVIRHMRFRPGDGIGREAFKKFPGVFEHDALRVLRSKQVILDHCSMSWALDETMDIWDSQDVTVQWSIIAEGLFYSFHHEGPHSMGIITQSAKASLHHNLLAKHDARGPHVGGKTACDIRNNVIYLTHGYTNGGEGRVNYVSNYIKRPNMRAADRAYAFIFFYPDRCSAGYLYASGNVLEGAGPQNQSDASLFGIARFDNKPYLEFIAAKRQRTEERPPYIQVDPAGVEKFFSREPLAIPAEAAVTTDRAEEAYRKVLATAGAILPCRDAVDARLLKEVEGGTGEIINSPTEVGGYPELKSTPPPADSDDDGMPDAWETQHRLNPKDPSDGGRDGDGDGYTNLEESLNGTDPTQKDPP